ncbi:hypothetical protein [Flavobacterium sp.]|uniref:hypothetical protein n=1 Tax=Flavobacterium sp. TaxID=239 RepID=UPI003267DA63
MGGLLIAAASDISGGVSYLQNTTNQAQTDTIGTASANDTSYIFVQNTSEGITWFELKRTSTSLFKRFKLVDAIAEGEKLRVRYYATDTTVCVERSSLLGYFPVSMTPDNSTTPQTTYKMPTPASLIAFDFRKTD